MLGLLHKTADPATEQYSSPLSIAMIRLGAGGDGR